MDRITLWAYSPSSFKVSSSLELSLAKTMASSSASLSLCSAFSSHCNVNSHRSSPTLASLSKPSLNLTKPVIRFLSPSTTSTSRLAFPIAPKFAESVVAEPETTDIEAVVVSDVAEVTEDKPKREEIFAVVMVSWWIKRKHNSSTSIFVSDFAN